MRNDASVGGHRFPSELAARRRSDAEVTMTNTGDSHWARDHGYRLGAVDDGDPFYTIDTRVDIPQGVTVAPGQSWTFKIPLVAPTRVGRYTTDWRMVQENVQWFGSIASATVSVVADKLVDASSLSQKILMGYQGWFGCRGDGSALNNWSHWADGVMPGPSTYRFDMWPDLREFEADELFDTDFRYADGSTAKLFSSYKPKTIDRHFAWMNRYGIDGITVGRFTVGVTNRIDLEKTIAQLKNIRQSAERHGRVFAIAYDITSHPAGRLVADLRDDWIRLVDEVRCTESSAYLRHRGKPVVMVWGLGSANNTSATPAEASDIVGFLKSHPDLRYHATVVGGVPTNWRTDERSLDGRRWQDIYRSFDVICPWMINVFTNEIDAQSWYRDVFTKDIEACWASGIGYMPTVFPGFSWRAVEERNGHPPAKLNAVRRLRGDFLWAQVHEATKLGSDAILAAMFDEVDEGTAMFKIAESQGDVPANGQFVSLNADGERLPSDWYLQLMGEATRMMRGEIQLTNKIPLRPWT